MEHRWGKRQSTNLTVRFVSQAKIGTGCLVNVSATGAFMRTKVHLRPLSVLNLLLASRSRKVHGKGVAACVVRQDSAGVGLEWCEAGKNSIEARLAHLAGDLVDALTERPVTEGAATSTAGGVRRTAG